MLLAPPLPLPIHLVHEFPFGTWVENLAVRPNDQILATFLTSNQIIRLDPLSILKPIVVASIPDTTTCLGITELGHDSYYVLCGIVNKSLSSVKGSYSLWHIDLTESPLPGLRYKPGVNKVADLPDAVLPDGLCVLSESAGTVLAADATEGTVYSINVRTGAVAAVIYDHLMAPVPPSPVGLNGLNVRAGSLFFTNTGINILGQIPVNPDGTPKNAATIYSNVTGPDDFLVDKRGNFIVPQNALGQVAFIPASGEPVTVLAGSPSDPAITGTTAARFGRTFLDSKSVYISSTGGTEQYVTQKFTIPGRVSRIDLFGTPY